MGHNNLCLDIRQSNLCLDIVNVLDIVIYFWAKQIMVDIAIYMWAY